MKTKVIKVSDDGKYKISRFIRLFDTKNKKYTVLYKNKYYEKESNIKAIKQITQVIEALNIKDKRKRIEYIYNKACDILDNDFYGKNVCEFKDNKCIHDRMLNCSYDGCCRRNNGYEHCVHLKNHRCRTRCMACKFHVCSCIRKKGLNYKVNDILVLKYLFNWKQKIIAYLDFFKTEEEVIDNLCKNNILSWVFKKEEEKFIKDND